VPAEEQTRLQIGHVLFIDIVGYSKLLVNEQSALLRELNEVVSGTHEFREAEAEGKLIRLPTGDGMALVFRTNPEAPAQCALEIARALKEHSRIALRMGIHSGPVNEVIDVNQRQNITGAGINMAQRVMDCGDTGHILASKHVAEDLEQHDRWRPMLHDLGSCEVKHGVRIDISNLYSDEIGNSQLPKKFETQKKHRAHVRWAEVAIGLLILGAIVAAFMIVSRKPATPLAAIPEKSIAVLPFVNMSEDKANEYFSDGISEELLNLLAKIPQLQVTARTSSFAFKGKEIGVPEIARTLHVANVLEGSVRKAGKSGSQRFFE
jgi:Adenylate and Guanylate cyclase catalytic domain